MKRSSRFGKMHRKVNRKDLRRKATNNIALAMFLIMTGVASIECIPLGLALIFAGAFFGYKGNQIEKELDK